MCNRLINTKVKVIIKVAIIVIWYLIGAIAIDRMIMIINLKFNKLVVSIIYNNLINYLIYNLKVY